MARFDPHPERRPAVVTGASSGIGRAIAEALAVAGHPVVLGARRVDECEATAESIRGAGGEAHALPLDLADPGSIEAFARAAVAASGPVEVLVSNAARIMVGAVLDTTSEDLDGVLAVNVAGTHRLVRALVPPMVDRRRGDVVVVTSDVVQRPRPSMAAYVTSKFALEGYVRALQMELEGSGVRATIVRPGPTLTGMGMDWDPTATAEVLTQWVSWGLARHDHFMRPQGIADAVVAAVWLPRGTHVTVVELQPEAPVESVATEEDQP
jgi:NAD(P)-dependent dehydrogenase (short-subunit alcohol dehydrogenase family)